VLFLLNVIIVFVNGKILGIVDEGVNTKTRILLEH